MKKKAIESARPLVWVTKTTTAGDTNARIGIAEQLGGTWTEVEIPTEFCIHEQAHARLVNAGLIDAKKPQWPDVIIGPSFHIPYMRVMKSLSCDMTVTVAMRPPARDLPIKAGRQDIADTDVIVSYPHHDNRGLPNILLCEMIAHRVTTQKLAQGQREFKDAVPNGTLIGLAMGGDVGDRRRVFTPQLAACFGRQLNAVAQQMGAGIIGTTSLRTSEEAARALRAEITVPGFIHDAKACTERNPYFGILGLVDYLVVTADSMSMCCEAVASGKPVYIFFDESITEENHEKVLSHLLARGYARRFNPEALLERFSYLPVNSAWVIAERIRACMAYRR